MLRTLTHKNKQNRIKPQFAYIRGISLVELMVAMAVGIVISGLAMNYLYRNLQTRNVNAAYSNLKDNGAMGMQLLIKNSREGGLNAGIPLVAIMGDSDITGGLCSPAADTFCTLNESDASDRLAIQMSFPIEHVACNGQTAAAFETIVEVFSITRSTDYDALVCQTYSVTQGTWLNTDQRRILQTGVQDLQVQFFQNGFNQAVNASEVSDWNLVQGIEIALLASSEIPARLESMVQNFNLLDRNVQRFEDRMARHIFQTTLAFNNKLLEEESE